MMDASNPCFYFLLMLFFVAEAWVLSKAIPFHRTLGEAERSGNHVLALDGLRGILALSVFFTHAVSYYYFVRTDDWNVPPTNFYSQMAIFPVSMFFFITGYLFWSKLAKSESFPAGLFLYRRLARLGGAYLFSCVLLFFLVAVVSGFRCNETLRKLGLEASAWLAFLGSGRDLNHIRFSRVWLGQAWSLQFEWMFYLILPLMGWFARKKGGLAILLGLAAVAALMVNRIHLGGAAGKVEEIVSRFLSFFLWTFSVGMIVATLKPDRWKNAAKSMPAAAVAFALIGITVFFVKPAYGWLESLALALPFASVCFGNSWFGLLTSGAVRFLGRISYSFYLLHMLVFTVGLLVIRKYVQVSSLGAPGYWGYALLFGLVAIIISSFSYQYFEHPLLHVGRPAVQRIVFAAGHASRSALAAKADPERS